VEGGGGSPRKANKSQGKTFTHNLPQMFKIQNISIKTKKVSIYLDKISITYKYLEKSRFVSKVSISLDDLDKISTQPSLDWKVSILKISTKIF
jgi:hypothetical protein